MAYGQMEEVAVACPSSSRIDIVGYDTGGNLYWIASNDSGATWGEWVSLGGTVYYGSTFGLVSGSSGTLDLVVVGTSGYVYHNHCTDWSWSGFAQIPGQSQTINSNNLFVGISTCGGGTVDVGWTCADRTVYHNTWHGSYWDGGVNLGGEGYYGAVPLSIDSSSCYIVTSGSAGDCYYRHRSGGTWGDWAQSGSGVDIGSPVWSVTSSYQNIIACFDTSYHLYWAEIGGAWNDGGQGVDSISLASRAANSWMLLINLSSSELPYSDEYNSGTWTGWYGPIKNTTCDDYEVKAAPKGSNLVMVALDTSSRYIYYAIWNGYNWSAAQLVQTQTLTSISQSAYSAPINTNVTISGYLDDIASNGLVSKTVNLYKNGSWVANTTTTSGGHYTFTVTDSVAHTDDYHVTFTGSGPYAASTSSTVYVVYTVNWVTVTAVKGTATATGKSPVVGGGTKVTAVKGVATATGHAPVIGVPATVYPTTATATATGYAPTITSGWGNTVSAVTATATATGIAPVVAGYGPPGVHEDNAIIEYTTWPASGTAVINEGIGGVTGNGTLATNKQTLTPSNDTAQILSADTDYVAIGISDINTLPAFTAEWLLWYSNQSPAISYLFTKGAPFFISYRLANILLDRPADRIYLERTDIGLNIDRWYTDITLINGAPYDIQVSWGVVGSTPLLKINDVTKSLTHEDTGPVVATAWEDDTPYTAYVCNTDTHDKAMWCVLSVFRLHNAALSTEYLTDNYEADWVRTVALPPDAVVFAVTAMATATVSAPAWRSDYNFDAITATATADGYAPVAIGHAQAEIEAVAATATATGYAPVITIGMGEAVTEIIAVQVDTTPIIGTYIIETEII